MDHYHDLVQSMRQAARYVHSFRQRILVLGIPGELIQRGLLPTLTHDITLLKALGLQIVLVHGVRPQVEEQLLLRQVQSQFHQGIRITDSVALECVKEAAGEICLDIEGAFSQGLINTPMANASMRVLSGNLVTAQPLGIIDGIDYQFTGAVRKIDTQMIKAMLQANAVVLLSPLGFSPTGEVFNLSLESVAQATASALNAHKLVFMVEQQDLEFENAEVQTEWLIADLLGLGPQHPLFEYAKPAAKALQQGVERVHFVPFDRDGALLLELFTHQGIGTMVTQQELDRVRAATIDDVGSLLQLIEPLEQDGTLVKRGRQLLEQEIDYFSILEYDGLVKGCVALYPFLAEKMGEMACLTVEPDARNQGEAERLLRQVIMQARKLGIERLFVLTTRTMHWFLKRGFHPASLDELPQNRKQLYNWQRKSQVLIHDLTKN